MHEARTLDVDALRRLLLRHPDIRLAYLFGSLARGRGGPESDLDLAILADKPLSAERKMSLIDALATVSGRPVDLIDLATVGEPLRGHVLAGTRLLGNDELHAAMIFRHVMDVTDFLPYRDRILRERRQAWIGVS